MPIGIERDKFTAKSRLVLVAMTDLTLRLMEQWWDLAKDMMGQIPDYESIMIVCAITSINADRATLEGPLESLTHPIPSELLGESNISSISSASGLNRETTRRRVNDLVKRGILVKMKHGFRVAPGVFQANCVEEALRSQLEAIRRAEFRLAEIGLALPRSSSRSRS